MPEKEELTKESLRKFNGCEQFACVDDCKQCLFGILNQEINPKERDDEQFEVFNP